MKSDEFLIFEAYKNFRTFVHEQDNANAEETRKAAKKVKKAADELDKTMGTQTPAKSTDAAGMPVGDLNIGAPAPTEPVQVGDMTIGAPAGGEAVPQPTPTDTSRYLPQMRASAANVNPQTGIAAPAPTPVPQAATPVQTQTTGMPAGYVPQGATADNMQGRVAPQSAEDEKLKQDALAREKQILNQARATIAAPRTTPVVMTTKGPRLDTRRTA
jgi:hypothetical protein